MVTPGEIVVGMDVAIFEADPCPVEQYRDGDGNVVTQKLSMIYDGFKGIPMKVTAVNLPYLVVHVMGKILTLDTRHIKFMELTPEYVNAVAPVAPVSAQTPQNGRDALRNFLRDMENGSKQP